MHSESRSKTRVWRDEDFVRFEDHVDDRALPSHRASRHVLILETDLYRNIGGGQTSYRSIVERCRDTSFYYFLDQENPQTKRPVNATPIPLQKIYHPRITDVPAEMRHFYWEYCACWQMAASARAVVGSHVFDVVDTPDYYRYGLFIRDALEAHDIGVGVVALALHGTVSSALADQWPRSSAPSRLLAELRLREHLQYRVADARYALSTFYAAEWERLTALPVRALDPLWMVGPFDPVMAAGANPVDLCFIGRRERRKGPDLAVDIAWACTPGTFERLHLIGAEVLGETGTSSEPVVSGMARRRGIDVTATPHLPRKELDRLLRGRNVVVLPSRYDQFNLVALEALRFGCPVFVSNKSGVARWIRETYPALSHLIVDIDCSRTAAAGVRSALESYDDTRSRIVDALHSRPPQPASDCFDTMYEPTLRLDRSARATIADIRIRFDSFARLRRMEDLDRETRIAAGVSKSLPVPVKIAIARVIAGFRGFRPVQPLRQAAKQNFLKHAIDRHWLHESAPAQIRALQAIDRSRHRLLTHGERTTADITAKLAAISSDLPSVRVGRVAVFRDMARLERKRGGDLIAATYCLRIMRWLGRDRFGDLGFVVATLKDHGFEAEAEVAHAMYGDPDSARDRCRALLDAQSERHRSKPDLPFEILDDRRGGAAPKVSVISSLYNAETKLKTLLDNMRIQRLAADHALEVVLVDSGSPTNEYDAFKTFAQRHDLPIVYARSRDRETIQQAWNRGIALARAPYLSFLGVDEGLHPDCLSTLADTLDRRPDVDWVMADSIVTEVDRKGIYAGDVMPYDRTGYAWSKVYLDTTYLSWVGGLYRRSIHDRFGYYDETFRAAGDTEFKGRVLSRIKTLHVPQLLGVFNNYPEERTTQSPRAELEDLRAWYLHRTPAGIAFNFDRHPVAEAEALFRHALTYRKAFCGHWSSDFDIAESVAIYLRERGEGELRHRAMPAIETLLETARAFDLVDFSKPPRSRQLWGLRTLRKLKQREPEDASALGLPMRPSFGVFNDNRHEQHWWSWSV